MSVRCRYLDARWGAFGASGLNRSEALRAMRAVLREHGRKHGLKPHWFDRDAIEIIEERPRRRKRN